MNKSILKNVYAIIPARSGSKGVTDKNIRNLCGKPLMAYSIEFAKNLGVGKVICSTDSQKYAKIAEEYGAEVPFLRSPEAASDTAMEQDILVDLYEKFVSYNITIPKYLLWLRPTFVFRNKKDVLTCINALEEHSSFTAARTVVQSENRLYRIHGNNELIPDFDDKGVSMMRRQDIGKAYKVFSTDIIRFSEENLNADFLGRKVFACETNKLCGLDIDDEFDFGLVESIMKNIPELIEYYV